MILALRLQPVGVLLALTFVTTSAVKCGDSITSKTTLTANLACDCLKSKADARGRALLTVVGPATLDLNGHTVSCATKLLSFTWCVAIVGDGATVQNGTVTGCGFGVASRYDDDEGCGIITGAVIKDIIAKANKLSGINLCGDDNRLVRVTATNSSHDGISLGGSNNRLLFVTANYNNGRGVNVYGDNNTLLHLTVKGNGDDGILMVGNNNRVEDSYASGHHNGVDITIIGNNSKAISNTVEDNRYGESCMRGQPPYTEEGESGKGGNNVFRNNTVRRCGLNGLVVVGSKVTIADNKFYSTSSFHAPSSASISAACNDSTITGNRITGSGADGIYLSWGRNMVVARNVIVNSARNGIILKSASVRSLVRGNIVRKCGTAGLLIRGSGNNNITENKITSCRTGIKADVGANRNRLINNRAWNSTLFDLSDLSANCGSNVWKGNTGKGNIPCTKK